MGARDLSTKTATSLAERGPLSQQEKMVCQPPMQRNHHFDKINNHCAVPTCLCSSPTK